MRKQRFNRGWEFSYPHNQHKIRVLRSCHPIRRWCFYFNFPPVFIVQWRLVMGSYHRRLPREPTVDFGNAAFENASIISTLNQLKTSASYNNFSLNSHSNFIISTQNRLFLFHFRLFTLFLWGERGISNRLCATTTIFVSPRFVETRILFNGKVHTEPNFYVFIYW